MRGEYPAACNNNILNLGSPPLARGVHGIYGMAATDPRITPACAGSTDNQESLTRKKWDHPRLRGEYITALQLQILCSGSPPLARGVPRFYDVIFDEFRITPACAGSTHIIPTIYKRFQDHPRLRGEYCNSLFGHLIDLGSPPLARGVRT